MSYFASIRYADSPQLDAFGRARVSEPATLFDCTHLYDIRSDLFENKTATGATVAYLPNQSAVGLNVTTTAGSRAVRQSYRYIPYQPGKSQFVKLTGVIQTVANNAVRCRIGIFDDGADKTVDSLGDGFFFQYYQGTWSVGQRSSVTGVQVDTIVDQTNWNIDPMDGTGGSGITLDPTRTQIFLIDLQWLGVGRVRMCVNVDGITYAVHEFLHANIETDAYTRRAVLPIRFEAENVDGGGVATQCKMICCEVASEGGYNPRGRIYSVDNGTTAVALSATTETGILAIRLRSAYNRATINPVKLSKFTADANRDLLWRVYLLPSGAVTAAAWTAAETDSATEFATNITAFSLANRIAKIESDYTQGNAGLITAFENILLGASNIAGQPQEILVTATTLSGASSAVCGLQFQEWI